MIKKVVYLVGFLTVLGTSGTFFLYKKVQSQLNKHNITIEKIDYKPLKKIHLKNIQQKGKKYTLSIQSADLTFTGFKSLNYKGKNIYLKQKGIGINCKTVSGKADFEKRKTDFTMTNIKTPVGLFKTLKGSAIQKSDAFHISLKPKGNISHISAKLTKKGTNYLGPITVSLKNLKPILTYLKKQGYINHNQHQLLLTGNSFLSLIKRNQSHHIDLYLTKKGMTFKGVH